MNPSEAAIALIGVIIAAVAGVGGARIPANGARQVAEMTQQEARATRYSDRTKELAAAMLDAANR